jgi:hypothetical protein
VIKKCVAPGIDIEVFKRYHTVSTYWVSRRGKLPSSKSFFGNSFEKAQGIRCVAHEKGRATTSRPQTTYKLYTFKVNCTVGLQGTHQAKPRQNKPRSYKLLCFIQLILFSVSISTGPCHNQIVATPLSLSLSTSHLVPTFSFSSQRPPDTKTQSLVYDNYGSV